MVTARGKMTAHPDPSMRHSSGTRLVLSTIMPAMRMNEIRSAAQKRLRIFGTSLKKLERSTSFFVADQVMLYEKRWAKMAMARWMERPPKKKKL